MKFLSNAFIFMVSFGRNHNDVAARRLGEYPELNTIGKDPSKTLQMCEGDCDSSSDCAPGLICFQRNGFTAVPGCSGTGRKDYDYCIYPELNSIGWNPSEPLQLCEGDCDSSSDCAPGLKCFKRNALEAVPGCSGTGISDYDYCIYPELNSIGWTPSRWLQLCEGDCDDDSDCARGLKCFKRNALEPVPGCSGTGISYYDYCIHPQLNTIGKDPSRSLQLCEGDCDNDNDCAPGLKCFQRNGLTAVPGCSGTGRKDYDYCIYPELNSIGLNPSETLQLCEGDCDDDNDCAPGLKCFKRNAFEAVPGCSGIGTYTQDYCAFECPAGTPAFTITLINTGTNTNFDAQFGSAKARWESIIKCGLADYPAGTKDWFMGDLSQAYTGAVDDVVIGYEMAPIDGLGNGDFNTLGFAGARYTRTDTGSPISGIMKFDEVDFASMSPTNAEIIILHEMGHVLGLVSVFTGSACRVTCTTTSTSAYTCPKAAAEYSALGLSSSTLLVDRNKCRGHWDEDAFPKSTGSSELMTPIFESGLAQPLTRVSIAALEESTTDYVVDYSTANSFPYTGSTAADKAFKALVPDSTFTIDLGLIEDFEPIAV